MEKLDTYVISNLIMEDFQISINLNSQTKYKKREEQHPIMKTLLKDLSKLKPKGFRLDSNSPSKVEQITLDKKSDHIHVITRQSGYNILAHVGKGNEQIQEQIFSLLNNIMNFFKDQIQLKIKNIEVECTLMHEEDYPTEELVNQDAVLEISKRNKIDLIPLGLIFASKIEGWDLIIMTAGFSKFIMKQMKIDSGEPASFAGYMLSKTVESYENGMWDELNEIVKKLNRKAKKGIKKR